MGRVPWFVLAAVGWLVGLLIGSKMYGERCVFEHIDPTCYPPEELKIVIATVVGLLTGLLVHLVSGLLVSRLRRSRRRDHVRS